MVTAAMASGARELCYMMPEQLDFVLRRKPRTGLAAQMMVPLLPVHPLYYAFAIGRFTPHRGAVPRFQRYVVALSSQRIIQSRVACSFPFPRVTVRPILWRG